MYIELRVGDAVRARPFQLATRVPPAAIRANAFFRADFGALSGARVSVPAGTLCTTPPRVLGRIVDSARPRD
jgi:hypothetical protein